MSNKSHCWHQEFSTNTFSFQVHYTCIWDKHRSVYLVSKKCTLEKWASIKGHHKGRDVDNSCEPGKIPVSQHIFFWLQSLKGNCFLLILPTHQMSLPVCYKFKLHPCKGLCHPICCSSTRLFNFFHINWIPKIMVQFCHLRPSLGYF